MNFKVALVYWGKIFKIGIDVFWKNLDNPLIMVRVFCVANQKGGVGKTTTAISIADGIAKSGVKTLLIDLDPQCNATSGLGAQPINSHPLVAETAFSESLTATGTPTLQLLPGSRNFADIEVLTQNDTLKSRRIRQHLIEEMSVYDYVLIDSPPSLGHLTQIALAASTEVFMPIQCEFFAMEGLVRMIDVIKKIMNRKPDKLKFGGIVLTMYDISLELTREVDREVRNFFGEIVFKTVIPRDVAISEAPSHGLSIIDYAPKSRGSRAYIELCMEVLERG
ncbi:MAG: ParA family protein [Planctomycetaceae bacterium]|jgi:chromosome partitioning protein|nr:ParA family protein [Planctomycetaceae bacterium]